MRKQSYVKQLWKPITSLTLASSLFFITEATVAAQAAEEAPLPVAGEVQAPVESQASDATPAEATEVSLAQSFPVDPEGLQAYQDQLNAEVQDMGPTEPSGNLDWVHIYETGNHNGAKVGQLIPEVRQSFGQVSSQALKDSAVSKKTKELVAIAISADDMCTKCISSHTINNLKEGTSRQEIAEAMGVVELYGGGPKTVSAGWVIDAYDTLKIAYEDDIKAERQEQMENPVQLLDRSEYENSVPKPTGQTNWLEILQSAQARLDKLDVNIKASNQALKDYVKEATLVEGALTVPQKQLIALGLGVNKGNDEVIALHTKHLLDLGVYRREVAEALGVYYGMGGAPDAMGASRALDAYDYLYHHFYPNGEGFPELDVLEHPPSQALYSDDDINYDNGAQLDRVAGDIARSFPIDDSGLKAYRKALQDEVSQMKSLEPSGNQDWVHTYETANHNGAKVAALIPNVRQAFGKVAGAGMRDGAVSEKTKELVAMVLSADDMCTKCITSHTLNSLKQGISRQEMAEAMAVVELFGGGPKSVSGGWVIDAYDTLKVAYEDEIKAGRLEDMQTDQAFDRSTLSNEVPQAVGDIDWVSILAHTKAELEKLNTNIPEVAQAMGQFVEAATAGDTALTHVQKELLALSLAVNKGSNPAIAIHVDNLLEAGVYRQEIAEALSIHFFMGGAADALYAARALDAYDALYHANYAGRGLAPLQAIESYESQALYQGDYEASQPSSSLHADSIHQSVEYVTDSLAQSFPVDRFGLQDYQDKMNITVKGMEMDEPSGHYDWVHISETGNHNGAKLGALIPGVKEAFGQLAGASLPNGAVSTKVKEYAAIALSADDSCTKCITSHTLNNLKQGTTRQEMAEVMGVVELFGGGPNTVRSGYVLDAYDTLSMAYADDIQAVVESNVAQHTQLDRDKHVNRVPLPSGGTDWVAILNDAEATYNKGRHDLPGVVDAFDGYVEQASLTDGALSAIEKQFVALTLAVNQANDELIALYTKLLLDQGVHRQEVAEVLSVAFFMGGSVDAINAARALDAYDSLYHALYADKASESSSSQTIETDEQPSQKEGASEDKESSQQEDSAKESKSAEAGQADSEALPQTGSSVFLAGLGAGSILSGLGLMVKKRRKY